jgi:ABC-type nitrate/sulfonate/bicarbonate transport system substrate-binding protein
MSHARGRIAPRIAGWIVAATAGLALVAAGCGGDDDSSGDAAGGANPVKSSITLGLNNPNYASQMPIFVAKAKGYFDDVGIKNVKVITTDNFVQGLVGGSLDISQGDTDQWLGAAAKSPEPIKYLATYRSKEWHIIGVKKGINDVQDLAGQEATAGERGGRNEFVLKTGLDALGLDPSKVRLVPLGGGSDARLQALINGQVAAAIIFPRHIAALEKSGGKVLSKDLASVPQEGIAVMGDFLDENRATVVAYLQATLKARQFIADKSNKDEVLKIMRDAKFDIPPEFEATYSDEVDQISPDGGFDPAEMDELVKEETQLDLLPGDLQWRDHVDLGPLHEAQKKVGLDENPTDAEVSGG